MPVVKVKKSGSRGSASTNHWFHKKSPAAKKAYIAAHPNSIYAKSAKKGEAPKAAGMNPSVEARRAAREKKRAQLDEIRKGAEGTVKTVRKTGGGIGGMKRKAAVPAHENWDGWDPEPEPRMKRKGGPGGPSKVKRTRR